MKTDQLEIELPERKNIAKHKILPTFLVHLIRNSCNSARVLPCEVYAHTWMDLHFEQQYKDNLKIL